MRNLYGVFKGFGADRELLLENSKNDSIELKGMRRSGSHLSYFVDTSDFMYLHHLIKYPISTGTIS